MKLHNFLNIILYYYYYLIKIKGKLFKNYFKILYKFIFAKIFREYM